MRRVQEEARLNYDADDEWEWAVFFERATKSGMRYRSQWSQYLRVILEAEREIVRLEGLYEVRDLGNGEVVFLVERVSEATNCDQARGEGTSPY